MSRVAVATIAVAFAADPAPAQPIDPMSVVYIECEGKKEDGTRITTQGSGVVVTDDGQVLTAKHVLPPEDAICRGVRGARARMPVHFMVERRRSRDFDAALLHFVEDASEETPYVPVRFTDLDSGMRGTAVAAFGFPLGAFGNPTQRAGEISTTFPDELGMIDVDARTTRGMSGGPVVLDTGELLGIVAGSEFDRQTAEVTRYAVLVAEIIADEFPGALESTSRTEAEPAATRTSDAGTGATVVDPSLPPELLDLINQAVQRQLATTRVMSTEAGLPASEGSPSTDDLPAGPETSDLPSDVPEVGDGALTGEPEEYPYRAVARIIVSPPTTSTSVMDTFVCTGFLVAENFAITARHCLFESPSAQEPWVDNILVVPGYNHGLAPFGTCNATNVFETQSIADSPVGDIGLAGIALDCNVGLSTGHLSLAEPSAGGEMTTLIGYAPESLIELSLKRDEGSGDEPMQGLAAYEGPRMSIGGASGSPIIEGFEPGTALEQTVVAVLMASETEGGENRQYFATPITADQISTIESWIEEAKVSDSR